MQRVSIRAILCNNLGQICLIHRIKNGNAYWTTPGGGLEVGESHSDALKRELREEVGSEITAISPTPILSYPSETNIQYFYTCREISRHTPTGDEYAKASADNVFEVQFIDQSKLETLYIVPTEIKNQIIAAARKLIAQQGISG